MTAASGGSPLLINGTQYRSVREGRAQILAPYKHSTNTSQTGSTHSGNPRNNDEGDQAVFYNPIQQYNRDLSVLAILVYGEGAVAQKALRRPQRKSQRRRKDKNTGARAAPDTQSVTENSKKRKADDIDANHDAQQSSKRPCVDEVSGNRAGHVAVPSNLNVTDPSLESAASERHGQTSLQESDRPRKIPFTILDALSASGLRAIRYAKEIPFATTIIANDLLPEAVKAIDLNIDHNKLVDQVFSNMGDARQYMYSKCGNETITKDASYVHRFDVVDLDPYGTAAPFLDAAIQCVTDGGLLCVTCTDAGVWASNGYPEKAYALYSGVPLKGFHSHEAGLRLILHAISVSAAKYGVAIEPLLSLSIDFYARLFVRVHKSQQEVKLLAGTTMMVYNCDQGCGAWQTQMVTRNTEKLAKNNETFFKHGFAQGPTATPFCEHCGSKTHLGGPMWAGPLHNPVFVQKLLDKLPDLDKTVYGTTDRIKGMLTVALEEEDLGWKSNHTYREPQQPREPDTVSADHATVNGTGIEVDRIIARLPPQLLSPSPLFFTPTFLSKVLSLPTPGDDALRGAILALGYSCTRSHCKPGSFKSDAPWVVIWEVMREYARQKHSDRIARLLGEGEFEGKGSLRRGSPGWKIMRRLRGRDDGRFIVVQQKERLQRRLGEIGSTPDIDTMADMKELLTSALWELEHPKASEIGPKEDVVSDNTAGGVGVHAVDGIHEADRIINGQPARISGKALIEGGGDVSELEVVFDEELGKSSRRLGGQKIVRYQVNPRANWGPMVRAAKGS